MDIDRPILNDHLKEAAQARRLAAGLDDRKMVEALLSYAESHEQASRRAIFREPPRNSGPLVV